MSGLTRLTVISPTQTFTFSPNSSAIKIGRSLKCDFNIPKEDLSREHCLFEFTDDEFFITDLGSKNGVCVDRVKLPPFQRTKVTFNSQIVLANIYNLKINALEIRTRSDIVYKLAKGDLQTVTFNMDFEVDEKKEEVEVSIPRPRIRHKEEVVVPKHETAKMLAGFIAAVGLVIFLVSNS